MKYVRVFLFLALSPFVLSSACKKSKTNEDVVCAGDCIAVTGNLQKQGITFYQYGTHIITTDNKQKYVVISNAFDLDKYIGKKVDAVAKDLHYSVEHGPGLYEVVAIKVH